MLFKSKIKYRWHYLLIAVLMCGNLLTPGKEMVSAMIPPATSICIRQPDLCFEGLDVTLQVKDLTGKNTAGFTSGDIETYGETKLKVSYTYSGENPGQTVNVEFYCDRNSLTPSEKKDGLSESAANGREFDCNYTGTANKVFFPKVVIEKGGERAESFSGQVTLVGAQINGNVYWQETKDGSTKQSADGVTSRRIEISGKFIYPGLQNGARVIVHCNKGGDSNTQIDKGVVAGDNSVSATGKYVDFAGYVCEYPSNLVNKNVKPEVIIQKDTGAYVSLIKVYSLTGKETIIASAEVYEYSADGGLVKVNPDGAGVYYTSDYPVIKVKQDGYTGDKTLDKTTLYKIWGDNLSCRQTASTGLLPSPVEYTSLENVDDPHDFYCKLEVSGEAKIEYGVQRGWASNSSIDNNSTIKLNINRAPTVSISAPITTIKNTDTLRLNATATDIDGNAIAWVGFYYCTKSISLDDCAAFSGDNYKPLSADGTLIGSRSLSSGNPYSFDSTGVLENGQEYNIVAAAQDVNIHPAIGISTPVEVTVNNGTINTGTIGTSLNLNYAVGSKQKEE